MVSKAEFANLLASGDRNGLQKLSQRLDTEAFLKDGYDAFKSLDSAGKKTASNIRDIYEMDRLDGLLMLITEMEMPNQLCFGPSQMGVRQSDYDFARTFLIKNIRGLRKGTPQPTKPLENFYPDVAGESLIERLLFVGEAHAGLSVTDDRQINLASCSGRFNYAEAESLIQRTQGTTCAVFLRALLDAAGDQRVRQLKRAFDYFPRMPQSMGCMDVGNGVPGGNGWIRGNKLTTIKRGDLYFIRDNAAGGSGHIGLIRSVRKEKHTMNWVTIDGGQGSPGVRLEIVNPRKFTFEPDATSGAAKDPCPWVNVNPGARRRLQGIVRLPA